MPIWVRFVIGCVLAMWHAVAAQPAGGVDLAWKVLPRRIAADNFGSRVAKLYFSVVAVVGNSSGHDLQVSSLYFRLPAESGVTTPIPVDPQRVVRGVLEREQQVGLRASAFHVINALGPMLTAGSTFTASGNYSDIVNMFTNPFAKGLELIFPDKTIRNLDTLDALAMRDSTLIPNNSQQVLIVFVGREMIGAAGRRKDFDTPTVMRCLGDLVLVGKSIEYVNRISVVSAPH